ncbi:hypothetical protein ACFRAO_31580 [Streptomyces sp. NPDC056656]
MPDAGVLAMVLDRPMCRRRVHKRRRLLPKDASAAAEGKRDGG